MKMCPYCKAELGGLSDVLNNNESSKVSLLHSFENIEAIMGSSSAPTPAPNKNHSTHFCHNLWEESICSKSRKK